MLYTSWRNSTQQDDDVKFWNSATQVDAFAAFNSTQSEDSDPFGITTTLVGFSTNRGSSKWQLWYGDPVTGDAASLNISQGGKHNLGAEYTLHKVTYQPPSADFDGDGDVDGHDFLTWQRGHGISAPHATGSDGDADHNLTVNALDLGVWQIQYGGGVLGTLREYTQLNQTAVDLAMQVYGAVPWPYSLLSENDGAEAPSLDSSPTRDSGWLSSEARETGTWKSTTPTALDASSINSSIDDAIDKSSSEDESANSLELSSDIFAW